jgi:hypothetical protein
MWLTCLKKLIKYLWLVNTNQMDDIKREVSHPNDISTPYLQRNGMPLRTGIPFS